MIKTASFSLLGLAASSVLLVATACDTSDDAGDGPAADGDTGEGETETGGEVEELDSDADGLTDAEEAELGTDPNDKDTDDDNYWDSWELLEGTDPLDVESRIYTGWWPYNPNKDELAQGSWSNPSTAPGTPFPRDSFFDRHGELVDLYDFANFTINSTGEPAHFIVDISAQWCGPCHGMAYWLGGLVSETTAGYIEAYPTLPDKVHDLQVWWVTFIVEGGDGGLPDIADTQSWYMTHPDAYIPVFVDIEQKVRDSYNGGFYPFVFLLDPELKVVHWDDDIENGNPYYALDFVEHEL
ncbi:hypothetical protein ENSA5_09340 [Enhygromyxa salina]|uniref:Thioredoxin domain-containing protein n=1 Tax=Enhygromyxa salina TaxID=215803 RepID=A0A2S9YGP5_9BACT|nr:hypothetical protein [Enhygromyxa salina]PRQ04285.1 hypothetical protein ENSA5_09340 [Enhygromyxa salina]